MSTWFELRSSHSAHKRVCGRYPLAVSLHKDNEATSSSLYAQGNPWEPLVSFEDFIRDNESIVNQVRLDTFYTVTGTRNGPVVVEQRCHVYWSYWEGDPGGVHSFSIKHVQNSGVGFLKSLFSIIYWKGIK